MNIRFRLALYAMIHISTVQINKTTHSQMLFTMISDLSFNVPLLPIGMRIYKPIVQNIAVLEREVM